MYNGLIFNRIVGSNLIGFQYCMYSNLVVELASINKNNIPQQRVLKLYYICQ